MTLNELLLIVNTEKPNSFGDDMLRRYVNQIEGEVAEQLNVTAPKYTGDDGEETLLADFPYDKLYVSFVKAKIDYANEEYESYTNNAAQHTQDFRDYVDYVVSEKKAEKTRIYNFTGIL